ncbi:energy transducer TonB [Flavobacterium sp. WLB]|uniref:energy transducer TonB n=1 Tax=unclassified Flavobacterium TaxID=196869 RepID=UPI0006ABD876|nr:MULTISPECIES: energy transducer TonB [unclassified Flavobacterium]KOP37829.1 energy transducer TonB [Flavobacterium sp. VMW]OWU90940.1 energy transducer TonB [Flavobacterium sp. NLM]PUU70005.1 energy transducer TonB [Flavobacterium sp. WLB]
MTKLSIYENKWIDLVFENKNKEYGAYQLRQENSKTTVTALFMALLLLTAIGSVSMLLNKFRTIDPVETEPVPITPLTLTDVDPIVVPKTKDPVAPPMKSTPPAATAPVTSSQLTNPVIVPTDQATQTIAANVDNTPHVDNAVGTDGPGTNVLPGNTGGEPAIANTGDTGTTIVNVSVLDKLPEFPGGIKKFYTYVGNNFTKPELDAEKTLRVYVSFVIEKDGTMTDIIVKNDPGFGMGKEAVRVLKSLKTKWAPGILAGKPVRTAYNLPITIQTGQTE